MKRKLIAVLLPTLLLAIVSNPVPVAGNALTDGLELQYVVTIDEPGTHLANVQLEIDNINQASLYLGISIRDPAFLSKLVVTDEAGMPLLFELDDDGSLAIDCDGIPTVVVGYDIEPSDWFGSGDVGEYISYIAAEYAMIHTQNLLFIPYHPVTSITVMFSLPAEWNSVTAWSQEDERFYPADIDDLLKTVGLGPFEIVNLESMGVSLRLGSESDAPRDMIIEDVCDFFAFQFGLFGDFSHELFMAVFAAQNVPPFIDGFAAKNTFCLASEYRRPVLAHEMFHMWNGDAIRSSSQSELWLLEGGTEFYTTDTLLQTNRLSPIDYAGTYNWHEEQVAELEQQLDISLLEACQRAMAEGGLVKDFAYFKGRLFNFLLNDLVYQATDGQKTMDDVMLYLFENFDVYSGGQPITNDDLLIALETVANTDFDDEFNLYLYGKASIPIEDILQDTDQDGLSQAVEIRYGTDPMSMDTDNDELSDGAEIAVWQTDPLDADTFGDGSLDGNRMEIKVDGRGGGWGNITPTATDQEGDVSQPSPGADLQALYLATDGHFLYIRLAFFEPPLNPDLLYQFHFDTDLDNQLDHYLVQRPNWFIGFGEYRDGVDIELDTTPIGTVTALDMDYRIPWCLLDSPTELNIGFRIRPLDEDIALDELDVPGYWLPVSKGNLPHVRNDITFGYQVYLPSAQKH